ncbi:phosphoribosylformylglycinamidine cyclo-ligase [Anaerosalibacter bizertensis]|uniref:phosphoribosylformylglycinamidine cyclo-ligase n=1 Tax=Anaerosalibacter bizertensis TaxID=932217 RepID=UPI001D01D8D3|nr:phosphoribosylformylglycinamidine cyclo-ligase [Anaerosalibacter bizertensis]MBV1819381.1 phosphoribosylformylglycinamidine cyclo-ligase [Bacteroidales bacterium MSK.15.36]MCB5558841.1 phosphoribosylformylglycinamidine cyclo-ligase [Anaerosalibacter bizertensis]MCG4581867.1 phosphoribosylformylglycinamidine cyclo-ligase [Anaerosalibacter bizertensis]MCG4584772.1 phosphoribosylformylglycinamidine cyclo-ligase [Anaerosalibacter bizertensis]
MKLTYKEAGVNKEAGYKEVQLIKNFISKTYTEGVLSNVGGFSGLFALDKEKYNEPVLVSGTDGVGTKLKIAFMMDKHDTVGEDCVAMCVNDILCQGAKPLFFLDYIATGKLEPEKMAKIVEGVANGCIKGGCALIGGETAEMPGFYQDGEYDMAGFGVGIVDKDKIIDGSAIEEGDLVVGLPSSGVHSNGYSLVRKIFFDKAKLDVDKYIPELKSTLGEALLKPTRIYTNPLYDLIENFNLKGISHITGGGFYENIPRMLPEGLTAVINTKDIERPYIFDLIQEYGDIDTDEMYSTFNMGIGIVFVVGKDEIDDVLSFLNEKGEKAVLLGEIKSGEERVILCHQ